MAKALEGLERLLDSLRKLKEQPLAGKPVESLPVRQWITGDYIARYLILDDQTLIIVRILHSREDRPGVHG